MFAVVCLKRSSGSGVAVVFVEVAKLLLEEGCPVVEVSCCTVPFAPLWMRGWLVAGVDLWPPIAFQELLSLTGGGVVLPHYGLETPKAVVLSSAGARLGICFAGLCMSGFVCFRAAPCIARGRVSGNWDTAVGLGNPGRRLDAGNRNFGGGAFPRLGFLSLLERAYRKCKTVVFTRLCDANITFIQNLSTLPVCFGGKWDLVCRQKEPSL